MKVGLDSFFNEPLETQERPATRENKKNELTIILCYGTKLAASTIYWVISVTNLHHYFRLTHHKMQKVIKHDKSSEKQKNVGISRKAAQFSY